LTSQFISDWKRRDNIRKVIKEDRDYRVLLGPGERGGKTTLHNSWASDWGKSKADQARTAEGGEKKGEDREGKKNGIGRRYNKKILWVSRQMRVRITYNRRERKKIANRRRRARSEPQRIEREERTLS